jgi:hypothetical protein
VSQTATGSALPHDISKNYFAQERELEQITDLLPEHALIQTFIAKIGFVVEEADESVFWLQLIQAAEIAKGAQLDWRLDESAQLSRIFNQSQLTATSNADGRRTK